MKRTKKIPFDYIEETRLRAGFFVSELCDELGISERSWYRWKAEEFAPRWVYRAVEILSGRLDFHGWKRWYICDGVLYRNDLNPKYYSWEANDLMVSVFCQCPAHQEMARRRSERERNKNAGRFKDAPERRLHGARAPAHHLPGSVAAVGRGNQERIVRD